jgi:hypothetical protein
MNFRNRLSLSVSLAALVVGAPALAADVDFSQASGLPAVSTINGKLGVFAGTAGGVFIPGIVGSLSLPAGHQYGLQLDGLVATSGGDGAYGIGGHFFWRDPAQGLLGLYAGYVHRDFGTTITINGFDATGEGTGKVGLEGEWYMDNLSLEGFAGYQFGTNTGFAGRGTVAFYPNPDLRLDLSVRHLVGPGVIGSVGLEWQPPATSMSLFADAGVSQNAGTYGQFGIKFYAGAGQKSLIQRHREDDPSVDLPHDLFGIIGDGVCPAGVELHDGSICGGVI